MLRSTGFTWKDLPIWGNAVAMTVPSRFSMKNAPATRMAIAAEFRLGIATAPTDSNCVSPRMESPPLCKIFIASDCGELNLHRVLSAAKEFQDRSVGPPLYSCAD